MLNMDYKHTTLGHHMLNSFRDLECFKQNNLAQLQSPPPAMIPLSPFRDYVAGEKKTSGIKKAVGKDGILFFRFFYINV